MCVRELILANDDAGLESLFREVLESHVPTRMVSLAKEYIEVYLEFDRDTVHNTCLQSAVELIEGARILTLRWGKECAMKNILGPIGQEFVKQLHDGEEWALWTGCDPNAERWAIRFDSREKTYQVLHGRDHDSSRVRYEDHDVFDAIFWLLNEIGIIPARPREILE